LINQKILIAILPAFAACAAPGTSTTPAPQSQPAASTTAAAAVTAPTPASYAGIDLARYPGDSAMLAWKSPASPYTWTGYYLGGPCHSDTSWSMKRYFLERNGWGTAVIYVGQQDWGVVTSRQGAAARADAPPASSAASSAAKAQAPACSASLLTAAQGTADAQDAQEKAWLQGFEDGSTIFLDVEGVTTVSPELLAYVRAWLTGVKALNRFHPGLYVARANAAAFHDAAVTVARAAPARGAAGAARGAGAGRGGAAAGRGAAGRGAAAAAGRGGAAAQAAPQTQQATVAQTGETAAQPVNEADLPTFWIAGGDGFSTSAKPTDVGLPYARVWQGQLNVRQEFGKVPLTVDVNVADKRSPSAPSTP
jgi:hypothetical protein